MLQSNRINVQIFPDLETISHKAAEIFLQFSVRYISSAGRFVVALSGGNTPRTLFTLLRSDFFRNKIDWNRIHFFWADERCVSPEDVKSNFKFAFDAFLSKVPVPAANIHRIKGEKGTEKSAGEYEMHIRKFFGVSGLPVFDMIILGMGTDGHTASLFSGSDVLKDTSRLVAPVYMEKPGVDRITLTLPVFNSAEHVIFLVSGTAKSDTVNSIFSDNNQKQLFPAGLINPLHGDVIWLIDQKAAQKLTARDSEYYVNFHENKD